MRHLRRAGQAPRRDPAPPPSYLGRPVCYGEGKIYWAQRFATAQGVDLGRSYFYTDSITDLPVLERVGEPRIVNPDPRLRRVAARRGWPVLQLGPRDEAPTFGEGEGSWRTNGCGAGAHPSPR